MTLIDKYYFNKYDIDYINGGLFHVAFYCLKNQILVLPNGYFK